MKSIKVKESALERKAIPVFSGCCKKPFMNYPIVDLFDFYGNDDGENFLKCHIARQLIARIELLGFKVERDEGMHNNQVVSTLARGRKEWTNEFVGSRSKLYAQVMQTLPQPVKEMLLGLVFTGITLSQKVQ